MNRSGPLNRAIGVLIFDYFVPKSLNRQILQMCLKIACITAGSVKPQEGWG